MVDILTVPHLGSGRALHYDCAQREHMRVPPDCLHHVHLIFDILNGFRIASHPRLFQGIHLRQHIGLVKTSN